MRRCRRLSAFSIIELLTVIGIIAILLAMILPALGTARNHARTIQCASNLRQLTIAMLNYSVDWKGAFPPNSNEIEQYWFNRPIMGRYLKSAIAMPDDTIAGGVLVCPSDWSDTIRSYAMNFFASSYISSGPAAGLAAPNPPGKLFKAGASPSSNLILTIESFSAWESPGHEPTEPTTPFVGYVPNAIVGYYSGPAGARFGALTGSPFPGGRFGDETACQVAYFHHRLRNDGHLAAEPVGRVNIGFLDGHVATFTNTDLADFSTGQSSFAAMWSPMDRELK